MECEQINRCCRPEGTNTSALTCLVREKNNQNTTTNIRDNLPKTSIPATKTNYVVSGIGIYQWDWKGGGTYVTKGQESKNYMALQPMQKVTSTFRIEPFRKNPPDKQSNRTDVYNSKCLPTRVFLKALALSNTQNGIPRSTMGYTMQSSRTRRRSSLLGKLICLIAVFQCLCIQPAFGQNSGGTQNTCRDDSDCQPASVNLLNTDYPMRTVDVSSTCGKPDGVTTPYRKSSRSPDYLDQIYYCNATDPHPKEYMYDHQNEQVLDYVFENPKMSTYWQSLNTIENVGDEPTEEFVIFNMTEAFLIRYIRVVFISPHITSQTDDSDMRPRAMVFERQAYPGSDWEAWRYYADSCITYFTDVPFQQVDGIGANFDALTPVCQDRYYAGSTQITGWGFGRQEVIFNPTSDYDREFQTSATVQRHYMASAVKLRLVRPSDSVPLSSYYAIGNLEVDGQCACFGHASVCIGDNSALCVCHHNTQGEHCEECKPLFNDKPWRPGALQQANACEDCGCGGHAVSCQYDEVKGYGVCDNCTDHTTGDKCQFCDEYFYINPENLTEISPTAQCTGFNGTDYTTYNCNDYCIPCNCSLLGTDSTGSFMCQNGTGDCQCKTHVEGRDCGVCKDEYWNLLASNSDGCEACDCERSGTFNNTLLCDKDDGYCICKNNTQGYRCTECKPGYFGLSLSNVDGCEDCGCDPGASLNTTCPVNTGVCPCREKITGRNCKTPEEGYYVPALDHLTFEAEFIPNVTAEFTVVERPGHGDVQSTVTGRGFVELLESSSLTFSVSVPRTLLYHVILRYETGSSWLNSVIRLKAQDPGDVAQYSCGATVVDATASQQLVSTLYPASMRGAMDYGQLCIKSGLIYDLSVELANSDPRNEALLIDSVVLLPALEELPFFSSITPDERASMQECYGATLSVNLALRANYSCSQSEYSIMAYLYDGAKGCDCDISGSNNSLCDPMGGQCPCKPGVHLLGCSQCQVDYYGFDTGQGCTPCACDPKGSVRTSCNDTGICECKDNVIGIMCDECEPEYYGLFTGNGCEKCACNIDYAYNNSCQDSGQCHCKPGVGGVNCDSCQDGFYGLTAEGCLPCDCDEKGSTSLVCDKVKGICSCKALAVGDKCDQCETKYYALGDWSPLGCLECYCSGHSTICDSASGWFLTNASNDWSLLNSATAIEGPWSGVDDQGQPVPVEYVTKIIGNTGQFAMQITNDQENLQRDNLFFLATDPYLGNKQSAYMHHLAFSLSMYVPPPPENETLDLQLVDTSTGDVILESDHLTFTLVVALPEKPGFNVSDFSYQMNTETWHVDTVSGPNPTYIQMIQMLSDLSAIRIRAKYSNVTGAEVVLYSALLTYATRDDSSGIPVNNVENCTCPKPYQGEECEMCSVGYTRVTPSGGPFTDCVPCNCHGHEDPAVPCDPETGECTCIHNTEGRTCDVCSPGYYGDPTRGNLDACKPCTCPGNVIENDVNVFAHTCELGPQGTPVCHNCTEGHGGDMCDECVNYWYGVPTDPLNNGGQCVGCQCNGRAETCNSTSGFCVDCSNNTAGKECDICASTYFGNAMVNNCEKCDCGSLGATGDCDHRTGQCDCKPNVVGFYCSECGPNSYNYSSGEGCYNCDCHRVGSVDTECNRTTGQCTCNTHLIGRRCDACEATYWNINVLTGCNPCFCTEEGTANITGESFGVCEVDTGQCHCNLDGIIGRTCDHCARGTKGDYIYVQGIYVGSYPNCELCGECFDNWAVKIDEVGEAARLSYNEALQIWHYYGNMTTDVVLPIIGNLSANISLVKDSINKTQILVTSLRELQQRYENVESSATYYTEEVDALELMLDTTKANLTALQNFDGTIEMGDGTSANIDQISILVTDISDKLIDLDRHANMSWDSIQNMTEAVRISNGSVQVFVERVATAMAELKDASAMASAAELILGGRFYAENANNTLTLEKQESLMQDFPGVISSAKQVVEDSYVKVMEANVTIDSAQAAVNVKMVEMTDKLKEAEMTLVNASNAKAAADSVKSVVDILKGESSYTRGNLTLALVEVVNGLETMDNISNNLILMDQQSQSIQTTTLRPLDDLTNLTAQIETTAVDEKAVEELMSRSQVTLEEATKAINITATATDAAHQTEELIGSIEYNLEQAEEERATTQEHLGTLQQYSNTIRDTTSDVQIKAGLAIQLSAEIQRNVSQSALEINSIYKCFQDKQERANATKAKALEANKIVEDIVKMHVENIKLLDNVTRQTETLEGKYTSQLESLNAIEQEVDELLNELGLVSGSTDVDVLLGDFEVQKTEMDQLHSDILVMDEDIDQTLIKLEQLDPETATCSHN